MNKDTIFFDGGIYVQAAPTKRNGPDRRLQDKGIPKLEDLVELMNKKKFSPGFFRGVLMQVCDKLKPLGAEFVGDSNDFHVSIADEAGDLIISPDSDYRKVVVEWLSADGVVRSLGEMEISKEISYKDIAEFIIKTVQRAGKYLVKKLPEDFK